MLQLELTVVPIRKVYYQFKEVKREDRLLSAF